MPIDAVQLTKDLIAIPSVSHISNVEIADFLEETLTRFSFEVERLEYIDENGERKASLVAKKGDGAGGIGFMSHSDTVPGTTWDHDSFDPVVEGDRLIGLGACDMKGPLAATVAAAVGVDGSRLQKPVFIVVTSDEEANYLGARQVVAESHLLRTGGPTVGVVAEPTGLVPVHAHKGGALVMVTAHGKAAHTSTDQGISANFLIAPFMAEMTELAKVLKTDESYMNHDFDPPTLGFNMVMDDGGTKPNVTAPKTVCILNMRPMPNDRSDEVVSLVTAKAQAYRFDVVSRVNPPFTVSPESEIVQAAVRATGAARSESVSFGTEANVYSPLLNPVVLGPGDIAQAHTVGEWIDVKMLSEAVGVYTRLIETFCM